MSLGNPLSGLPNMGALDAMNLTQRREDAVIALIPKFHPVIPDFHPAIPDFSPVIPDFLPAIPDFLPRHSRL